MYIASIRIFLPSKQHPRCKLGAKLRHPTHTRGSANHVLKIQAHVKDEFIHSTWTTLDLTKHCCCPGRTPKALAVHRPSRSWEIHGRHLIHRPEVKDHFDHFHDIRNLRNVRGLSKPLEDTSWSLATTWEGPVCKVPVPSMSIPQMTQESSG